jgi:hypothetical protein
MESKSVRGVLARPIAVGAAGILVVGAVSVAATPAGASPATASKSPTVASGKGWTVTRAAGGYRVRLTLATALPTKDDVPVLVADGKVLGGARESRNGRVLSITTTNAAVAKADAVSWQWSSGGRSLSTGSDTAPDTANIRAAQRAARASATPSAVGGSGSTTTDPTDGTGAYRVADYNFGTQSIPLANLGGTRGELEGRIYLPSTAGPHPLVIFLHGRHSTCYNLTTLRSSSAWPCPTGTTPILSYAGYDGGGDALAADGYTVVSISANSINAYDGSLGADAGAVARGQLILDSLTMLKAANAGSPVSYHDTATNADVTLDQALVAGRTTSPDPTETVSAADLVNTMDFDDIGLMGHSRGGEGAVTAGVLNEGLANPWHIKSIFALAPIDFTRATLPDVITTTLLPYCDGDVSDQQGQHFYADSRNAFSDNVQRSDIWVMGTDHDFYNSSWTPPYPGASDDWTAGGQSATNSVCGASAPTTSRLTPAQQFQVGSAYLAGFFELTLGGQTQYQGMFDGSGLEPPSVAAFADVRTIAQQPADERDDITDFASTSPLVNTSTTATAVVCASRYGRTVPEPVPSCTSPTVALASAQQPYWTPASYAPNVPLNQMTHLTWTATTGSLSVTIPAAKQDVSSFDEMTVNASPDDSVTTGTDMTVTVSDSSGHTYSSLLSALNPWTVNRMPQSTTPSADLGKIVLQQAHVPTATLAAAGLDLTHISRVTFTAAVGLDGTTTGGEYLQDLNFDTKALGTPSVQTRPTMNVASTKVEEGSGASTKDVAVYLSQAGTTPITGYLSVIGSATGKVGLAMQQLTFQPGQTCQSVEIPTTGDTTAGTTASTAYKIAVSDTHNAVLGVNDFGTVTVREDDGTTGTAVPIAPVGVQGDACAEFAALSTPGPLTVDNATPAPGGTVTLGGSGYRNGESVAFTIGGEAIGSAVAGPSGTVSFTGPLPADVAYGSATITGTGFGSGYVENIGVDVLATTTTTLALNPTTPGIDEAATLQATVTGVGTEGGTVDFSDGTTSLGTAPVVSGVASLSVATGFAAGTHDLTATFEATATANTSTSNTVELMLTKAGSAIALALTQDSYAYGASAAGVISVAGATEGTATVVYGATTQSVPINGSGAGRFTIPGPLRIGLMTVSASYDGTDLVAPSGTASANFTVVPASTTSVVKLTRSKVAVGQAFGVTVTVGGRTSGYYPGGTVTVTWTVNGNSHSRVVSLNQTKSGVVTISLSLNHAGPATVSADYSGDGRYTMSSARSVPLTVT